MTEPFVDQLASLCREQVTRAKWVFVPSHAIGRTIGERIALGGTNWLNLRFVTPLDVALRMGAPFLVERGIEPSEEGLGPALMMRLLLDMPKEGGYFPPLADQPTLAQALSATVRELRMAALKSSDLRADAFENPAKHAELQALLASYEKYLADNSRGDMAVVYEEAMKHADWCPIGPEDCWTELPDVVWLPLQRRLMDSMPGQRIKPLALAVAGASIPRRFGKSQIERVAANADGNPRAFLLSPDNAHATSRVARDKQHVGRGTSHGAGGSVLSLFHAGGREAEVEEVFRRILGSGAPLDRIEIACATDDHVSLVWEKALRHEWPITLGPGIAAAATRPGRALIGLCDWIETDFSAGHLRRLLQSGDMGLEEDDEGFTAGEAARIIARAEAGWGRATYGLSLPALRADYEARAKDADLSEEERDDAAKKAGRTSLVHAWVEKLIASIPEPGATSLVPVQQVVDATLVYLDQSTARSSALDHRAAGALAEYIAELRALGTFACPLAHALRFIRERVQSLQVAPDRPRPGHLYVCRLAQASFSGRPHLFVVGLEEGRVFPSAAEDAVLLDAERAAISPDLRLSTDKIDETVYSVLARLAAWGDRAPNPERRAPVSITFSYSCRDTREFRETYASWLMLHAYRLQQGDATLTYPQMKAALGDPVSCVPRTREAAPALGPWWLRTVVGTGEAGAKAVAVTFGGAARGKDALAARASEQFTEFDGLVPEAGAALDPCTADHVYSVTDLESAAGCPFRFFLKRGLGIRPVDGRERDRDVWLDPLTRGAELHDLYAALWRRCRDARRRPDLRKDGPWLHKLAEARLAELQIEMPAATGEIFARESADFLADVELFLEGECEDSRSMPIAFEVSFGRPLDDEEEELARVEPVEITLGGKLKFRIAGRIDRIDRIASGKFEILDYKTGGFWRKDWTGTFRGGRRLQHALYGLAAVEILKAVHKDPKVTGGVYYFSSQKGRQERVTIAAPSVQQIAGVLSDLRDLIVTGAFVHAPDDQDCTFCDFAAACGSDVQAHAAAKLVDPRLKSYERLKAHE